MTLDQILMLLVLTGALGMFMHGKFRYDVVALLALFATGVLGLVPPDRVFAGFGHPAVITVAAVLVLTFALLNSGLIDVIAQQLGRIGARQHAQMVALTLLVTVCSAFMNNVGALAVVMPVAIQLARKHNLQVSQLLMPLAFGSLLGGLMTAIGTPANIIIATYRNNTVGEPFSMFDYSPVGMGVALAGLVFMWLIGWRLLPRRANQGSREELFAIEDYLTELRVPEDSSWSGKPLRNLETAVDADITVVGVVRGTQRLPAPSGYELMRGGDILIVESDAEGLKLLQDKTGFVLGSGEEPTRQFLTSDDIVVSEAIVGADSLLVGRSAGDLMLRRRYGLNMLAIARQGERLNMRLHKIALRAGDVLLLQGHADSMPELFERFGWLPLAERKLRIGNPRRIALALSIFGGAMALAATGVMPIALAFTGAVIAMVVTRLVGLRDIYQNVEWPVIVLLGAMIPLGEALELTGGAQKIADALLWFDGVPPIVALAVLMAVTMALSDVINNAATAVLMAPVAVTLASGLGVSADPFLMSVAVGASAAFLTPIGHQSNTLVMGPGGYQFSDYWKLGLPLSVVYLGAAIPLILRVWPL
ncbi:MAG: SLC13 family permease [Gammaproteobacteria bacterium]